MSTAALRTWCEISRDALLANVQLLRSTLGAETTYCANVRAHAYGHDSDAVVRILREAEVRYFSVGDVDEGLAVRRAVGGAEAEVLVEQPVPAARLREAIAARLTCTVIDEAGLLAVRDEAVVLQSPALVILAVETGFYHLGMPPRQVHDAARIIAANPRALTLVGLTTQLATSREASGQDSVDRQASVFAEAVKVVASYQLYPPLLHIADSAAVITRPDVHFSLARCGSATYGLWPSHELKVAVQRGRAFELRPVLAWKASIAQIKDVTAGSAVGEGYAFIANRPMRLAIVAVGYADGYDRGLSGKGRVLVKGYPCPVVGRVGMRTVAVDVSTIPHIKSGEPVTLLGKEGMHTVAAEDLAAILGTIHTEVVARINPLIPRIVV